MNIHSHVIATLIAARRRWPADRSRVLFATAGAVLPDVPYLYRGAALLARRRGRIPVTELMTELDYFTEPNWEPDLALHSLLSPLAIAAVSPLLPGKRTRACARSLALGWAGHNVTDMFSHGVDARPHLWPLSARRIRVPVPRLGVAAAEHAVIAALVTLQWRRAASYQESPAKPRDRVRQVAAFAGAFATHPRQVGAILPTSRPTVRAMLDMTSWGTHVRRAVELGAGTGVYTEAILNRLGPDASLMAFELDPRLARELGARLADDRRLRVISDSAVSLASYMRGEQADLIVCALPLTTLPAEDRELILSAARAALAPQGAFLAIQYSTARERDLKRHFYPVFKRLSLRNVPPAVLYLCRTALPADAGGLAAGNGNVAG